MMPVIDEEFVEGSTTSAEFFTLTSWTPSADDLVLVFIWIADETITPSLSGNSLAFTAEADVEEESGGKRLWCFRAMDSSPTTGSITVTITGNSGNCAAIAVRFSGSDPAGDSTAVEASAVDDGPAVNDDDMLASVTTITDNALAVAFGGTQVRTLTLPGGETAIAINRHSSTAHVWKEGPVLPPAATQLGDTADLSSNSRWAMIVVSIKPESETLSLSGTLTTSGSLVKRPEVSFSGGLTFVGAFSKKAFLILAGSISFSGALSTLKTVVGSAFRKLIDIFTIDRSGDL